MKTHLALFLFLLTALLSTVRAQEKIILNDGREVAAKVLEVGSSEIRYKRSDLPEGPDYRLYRRDVLFIKYPNGVVDTLSKSLPELVNRPSNKETVVTTVPVNEPPSPPVVYTTDRASSASLPTSSPSASSDYPSISRSDANYLAGRSDAEQYYKGYKGAGTGTLLTTFLTGGILGLIPAVACSSTPPKEHSLGIRNDSQVQNAAYRAGYAEEARRIKSRKVWTNYGIGVGMAAVFGLLVFASR